MQDLTPAELNARRSAASQELDKLTQGLHNTAETGEQAKRITELAEEIRIIDQESARRDKENQP